MLEPDADEAKLPAAVLHANILRVVCEAIRSEGIDPERLCAGTGLTLQELEEPSRLVSFRQSGIIIRRAMQLAPNKPLGLLLSRHVDINTYGIVGLAMMSSETLGEALKMGGRYAEHVGAMVDTTLAVTASTFSITFQERYPENFTPPFCVEMASGVAIHLFSRLLKVPFVPLQMEFRHDRPPYAAQYEEVYRCPVLYRMHQTRLTADRSWLAMRLPTYDPLVKRLCEENLDRASRPHPVRDDLLETVESMVRRDPQGASIAQIAARLNMSGRTLSRRLAAQGITFREMADKIRSELALSLLRDSNTATKKAAQQAGFSDAHSFRRAVKRWTGEGVRGLKHDPKESKV